MDIITFIKEDIKDTLDKLEEWDSLDENDRYITYKKVEFYKIFRKILLKVKNI